MTRSIIIPILLIAAVPLAGCRSTHHIHTETETTTATQTAAHHVTTVTINDSISILTRLAADSVTIIDTTGRRTTIYHPTIHHDATTTHNAEVATDRTDTATTHTEMKKQAKEHTEAGTPNAGAPTSLLLLLVVGAFIAYAYRRARS